jgi:hypothetical protein
MLTHGMTLPEVAKILEMPMEKLQTLGLNG